MIDLSIFIDFYFTPFIFGSAVILLLFKTVLKLLGR